MIGLSLLLSLIIGLLWQVFRLLKRLSGANSSLAKSDLATAWKKELNRQNGIIAATERNKEINMLISTRLAELEQQLHILQNQPEDPEGLNNGLKQVIHTSLKMLKKAERNATPKQ